MMLYAYDFFYNLEARLDKVLFRPQLTFIPVQTMSPLHGKINLLISFGIKFSFGTLFSLLLTFCICSFPFSLSHCIRAKSY